jgi:hypothetical protein
MHRRWWFRRSSGFLTGLPRSKLAQAQPSYCCFIIQAFVRYGTTMPSADFCHTVRMDYSILSPRGDNRVSDNSGILPRVCRRCPEGLAAYARLLRSQVLKQVFYLSRILDVSYCFLLFSCVGCGIYRY